MYQKEFLEVLYIMSTQVLEAPNRLQLYKELASVVTRHGGRFATENTSLEGWFKDSETKSHSQEFAEDLEALGPTFVKLGQMLSTRADLFSEDLLGDDLDEWLAQSILMKRTFRACAEIAQLIERRHPGTEKTGRQVTVSTDLVYDVLRSHEPDHILLRATWADAATGLLDIRRLGEMLARVKGDIVHQPLTRISPLAVPIMLEIGKEIVHGEASEALLGEAAELLVSEAMG